MAALAAAVLLLAYIPLATAGSKCHAIAFSGGGDKGSFEAGVVQGLVARLPPAERRWNVMTGISAGSIMASAGALFPLGDEVAMADFMVDSTVSFTKQGVYRDWFPGGILQGALFENGLFNTDPFYRTLKQKLSTRPLGGRNFTIGATEDATGDIVLFDESMVAGDPARWATYVRASSALPGLFQSVKVDGRILSDGGCVLGADVFTAVARCRQMVKSDEDIVLDVVTCDSRNLKQWDVRADDKTLPLWIRGMEEQRYNKQMADILDACLAYPNINFRYYVEPPPSELPSNGFNFNKTQMLEMVEIGRRQAASVVPGGACIVAQQHRASRRWPWNRTAATAPTIMV